MKMHRSSALARRNIQRCSLEALERRELLTAVIDLRLADGTKAVILPNTPGQTVNIDVFATVTGTDATGSNDGFQDLFASFVSKRLTSGSVHGDLGSANVAPFTASGSAPGVQADLNADGSVDVGSTSTTDPSAYFFARAGSMQFTGVVDGASQTFKIGTLAFAVTSLASGGETDINVVLRDGRTTSVWNEDGQNKAPLNGGVITVGAPIRITAAGTAPPPTGAISGKVIKDTNGDGKLESGETGLAGVTVYIDANKNGVLDAGESSQVTPATGGAYGFTGLVAGTYRVREVVPANYKLTAPIAGYFDVVVAANAAVTGENFFNQPKPPALGISGTIYKDLNGDGKLESGETGLAGVTVFIDANKNGVKDATEKSAVTSSTGAYSFTGLTAGTYRVREVLPTTAKLIAPAAGYYDVVITTAAVTARNFFDQPKTAVVVTVDNPQATKTGTWTALTTPAGFYGVNYLSDTNTGKGTKSAAFHAALPSAGQYLVYARWPASATQSAKVPIDIKTATSTTTVYVNQQANGNSWVLLGTFTFDVAKGATITIRNAGTTGTVIADAVQLVKVV